MAVVIPMLRRSPAQTGVAQAQSPDHRTDFTLARAPGLVRGRKPTALYWERPRDDFSRRARPGEGTP